MTADKKLQIRLTEEQLTRIKQAAQDAKMSVTLFLLRSALGEMDRFTPPAAAAKPVVPARPAPVAKVMPAVRSRPAPEVDDEDELFDGMMRSDPYDEELSQRYNMARGIWEPWEG